MLYFLEVAKLFVITLRVCTSNSALVVCLALPSVYIPAMVYWSCSNPLTTRFDADVNMKRYIVYSKLIFCIDKHSGQIVGAKMLEMWKRIKTDKDNKIKAGEETEMKRHQNNTNNMKARWAIPLLILNCNRKYLTVHSNKPNPLNTHTLFHFLDFQSMY